MHRWSVCVELDSLKPPKGRILSMADALEGHHPMAGEAESGNLYARVAVYASDAHVALSLGYHAIDRAARHVGAERRVVGLEVSTEEEPSRRRAV